jgi:hypothetical protein
MLKVTGFETIDRLNKENFINTVLAKYESNVKGTPNAAFLRRVERIFGDDQAQVIEDLRNQVLSEEVKYLLFNELLDIQPLAITEMPESWSRGGNWRLTYVLKGFYLRRLDFLRQEAFTEMKSAKTFARGFGKMVWLATAFALMGVPTDWLKDFLTGRKMDISESIWDSILKMFFFSRWQARRSSEVGAGRAALEQWLPPTKIADATWKDILKLTEGKDRGFELWRSVPVGGEMYFWWFSKEGQRRRGVVDLSDFED